MTDLLHNLDWVLPLRTPALTSLAFGLSWLGYSTFIMFFMAVGYWTWSKAIFFRVMLLVAFSAVLNAYVKDLFQDPRPPLSIRLDDLVGTSYGLPSGHAQLAVVIWMWLAYELKRKWAWVLCALIALGVMLSRLYLGAHDVEDVLAGAVLGSLTLVAFARIKDRKWSWQDDPVYSLALIALVTAAAMITWPDKGIAPVYVPTLAGWMAGGIVGLRCEERVLGFSASPIWWRKALAAVIGAVAFIALQKILKLAGASLNPPPLAWEAVKGLIAGFFIALPVPWMLAKLQLVAKRPSGQLGRMGKYSSVT
ncbi:phosphatase PAP2 family protein [Undibacterium sp.]|jgi:membrane-associated phospholipid phosphatase|uniref:phosphatase PAP2 family protein n=1 Tax=Undibacterium sp. TaxID=1914977 RepID=UPI002C45CA99|nr:phosphatase PAP2 family protein [Undibacterium sp.]HTD06842.1 phosphatase PAP2 family protein [Undibacterium sp.]